jgi:hypothetical protein
MADFESLQMETEGFSSFGEACSRKVMKFAIILRDRNRVMASSLLL